VPFRNPGFFAVASAGLAFVKFLLTVNCDVAIYNLTTTLLHVRWFLMFSGHV
jgi:hypothetical protein